MKVVLLGTAAGGGFPQWNCWCPGCRTARTDPTRAHARTQSSAAVSADGIHWFLLNASPDIREQLRWLAPPTVETTRHVPIEAVVFTDAELDHTLGLLLLREAGRLSTYATAQVKAILTDDSRLLTTTRAFSDVRVTDLPVGGAIPLRTGDGDDSGLQVEAFAVAAGPPRFASDDHAGHTVGLFIRDGASGSSCAFVPGCGELESALLTRLAGADALLFDGTFWTDDELIRLEIGTRTARQLDHLPISGRGGSLELLADLPCRHRVYTHITTTNPMLLEDSRERGLVTPPASRLAMTVCGSTCDLCLVHCESCLVNCAL